MRFPQKTHFQEHCTECPSLKKQNQWDEPWLPSPGSTQRMTELTLRVSIWHARTPRVCWFWSVWPWEQGTANECSPPSCCLLAFCITNVCCGKELSWGRFHPGQAVLSHIGKQTEQATGDEPGSSILHISTAESVSSCPDFPSWWTAILSQVRPLLLNCFCLCLITATEDQTGTLWHTHTPKQTNKQTKTKTKIPKIVSQ